MNYFDQAARYAAKLDPAGFFAWLAAGLLAALAFRGWLDTRTLPFPGEPDRTCDTVAEFHTRTRPRRRWALVVEFQSRTLRAMLDRLHEYLARVRRELGYGRNRRGKYLVAGALVNLTGQDQPDTLTMLLPIPGDVGLRFKVVVRSLPQEDAAATLAEIAAGQVARCILPWVPLMRGGADSGIIAEWKRLAAAEPDERLRADYAGLALVFAELPRRHRQWQRALEGWNVRQSKQVLEWQKQAREEERIETKRKDLLRVLRGRFSGPLPGDIVTAVEESTDIEELDRCLDIAGSASLEALRKALRGETHNGR